MGQENVKLMSTQQLNKLTVKAIAALTTPGKYGDGGGLHLVVEKTGAKRWLHIYQIAGRRRDMGLGPLAVVSLAEARELRDANLKLIQRGEDPLEVRRAEAEAAAAKRAAEEAADAVPFFEDYAKAVARRLDVRREQTRLNWLASVAPKNTAALTGKRVNEIVTADVRAVLDPIWKPYPVKAKKLRQKLQHVLDVARAAGFMGPLDQPYQNPAAWDGHLKLLMPKRKHKTKHFTALPHEETAAFMGELHQMQGMSARLLEFMILTVPRGHEVRHMRLKNLFLDDGEHGMWAIPDEDQKSERGYWLPLSAPARAVLDEVLAIHGPDADPETVVFCSFERGPRWRKELSHRAAREVVGRMSFKGRATPHGFRSTFRDWAGDETDFAREVIEHCLSHAVGDEVELSYRRRDALEKRRVVLDAWAARCGDRKADKVVALGRAAA